MTEPDKEKEFEEAIDKYGGLITKICYYFSSDPEEFKDLRQEVFYYIWKGLDHFRNESKISTWIYRVCFNTCISYRRKENKSQKSISIEEITDLPDNSEKFDVENYNRMHEMIKQLNFQDRALILLWLDEKSYEEIADLMGMTRNNVAVRLKRIKDKLIKMTGNE